MKTAEEARRLIRKSDNIIDKELTYINSKILEECNKGNNRYIYGPSGIDLSVKKEIIDQIKSYGYGVEEFGMFFSIRW